MKSTYHRCLLVLIVMAPAWSGGCASGRGLSRAHRAEREGDYGAAYDAYCETVRAHPSAAGAAASLRRVAPLAARDAEQRAHAALGEGRPIEAWRLFMRVLEIQPDHPSAAQLIRRIERDYPVDTRRARARWERDGLSHIASRSRTARGSAPATRSKARHDDRVTAASPSRGGAVERPAPRMPAQRPVAPKPATRPVAAHKVVATRPAITRKPVPPAPRPHVPREPRAYRFGVRHHVPPRSTKPPGSGYLVRVIISHEDDRYEDSADLTDGLRVRIRDTDADPLDADIEIRRAGRRIAKYKNVRVGRAIPVTGRSGKKYYVKIITIRDATETVTVGITPARSAETGRR